MVRHHSSSRRDFLAHASGYCAPRNGRALHVITLSCTSSPDKASFSSDTSGASILPCVESPSADLPATSATRDCERSAGRRIGSIRSSHRASCCADDCRCGCDSYGLYTSPQSEVDARVRFPQSTAAGLFRFRIAVNCIKRCLSGGFAGTWCSVLQAGHRGKS